MIGLIASTATLLLVQAQSRDVPPGNLTILQKDGKIAGLCPLKSTSVVANVAGFGADVAVVQTFTNPSSSPIEAIYTFPLPNDASVDRMTMKVGSRTIIGQIKKREEARIVYEQARANGQVASLLDQERPNIFTQSIANIVPGAAVQIEIHYVQILKFEDGEFEFNFHMVVGPRFLGNAPDPALISPPTAPKGTRTGANIDLTVNLDAGAPIQGLRSILHEVAVNRISPSRATISLKHEREIPNRDFILKYGASTASVSEQFFTEYSQSQGGFFSLVLLPPDRVQNSQIAPREMVFVMDQSGSQNGFPIEKSKELTVKMIQQLRPNDSFDVISFGNEAHRLWPASKPNTASNRSSAIEFVKGLQANGGTQLRNALSSALTLPEDQEKLRIILFNTDGFVGDDKGIIEDVRKYHGTARVFTFGIGNGVNRYLIDGMSAEGRGAAEYVTLSTSADEAVQRFMKRMSTPVLTDISVKVANVGATELTPDYVPDVFSVTPVTVSGRYSKPGPGVVTVTGNIGGKPWSRTFKLNFPSGSNSGQSVPSLWARRRVDDFLRKEAFDQQPSEGISAKDRAVDIALQFGIMTEYTSFVAVEQKRVNVSGELRTVNVPVEAADGVSMDAGAFLDRSGFAPRAQGGLGGFSGGGGGGLGQGIISGKAKSSNQAAHVVAGTPVQPVSRDKSRGLSLENKLSGPELKKANFESKVDSKLKKAKGKILIQIELAKVDSKIIEALAAAGMKIDSTDKSLKVAFGSCDAKALMALAQIAEVQRIVAI